MNQREKFYIKEKYWRTMNLGTQEALCQKKDVILIEPVKTKRDLVISFLNKIDFTTKEGQENMKKFFDKYEEYMKKFDGVMSKFDSAFGRIERR